jgi:hypothetical protein
VTDANDDSAKRVLDLKVQVRPALKAALAVLKVSKDLPFQEGLTEVTDADIDEAVKDGTAHGTITLEDSHFTQFTVDIESVRSLDPEADGAALTGSRMVLDVDDSADALTAPTDVSTFDLGEFLDSMLEDIEGQVLDS